MIRRLCTPRKINVNTFDCLIHWKREKDLQNLKNPNWIIINTFNIKQPNSLRVYKKLYMYISKYIYIYILHIYIYILYIYKYVLYRYMLKVLTLILLGILAFCFELGEILKQLARIMLATQNLLCRRRHICSFRCHQLLWENSAFLGHSSTFFERNHLKFSRSVLFLLLDHQSVI